MCGIVGFKSDHSYQKLKDLLRPAVDSLHHRGPNDKGVYFDAANHVGLGHRRLSIIDLSTAGLQPMHLDDGNYSIVYNGEVYNFKSIRRELEGYGYRFKSETDSEVVLAAYRFWGKECMTRFVGMFAFAIWDKTKKSLFLARDRLGIKPLYYFKSPDAFIFASELKPLMILGVPKNVNPDALSLFLHYQYVPAPLSIFENVYKLLPGQYLQVSGGQVDLGYYWHHPEYNPQYISDPINENEILDELDYLICQAVKDRLVSDVPIGALLSGGIDSSLVSAIMKKVNPASTRTFSIGFKEKEYNEAPWAAKIADYLGTQHTELYVTPQDALNVVPKLPDIYDEPFADSSAIPTHLVSMLTKSQVTVALSGDGGDEQFLGYVRYWSTLAMDRAFSRIPHDLRRIAKLALGLIPVNVAQRIYMPLYPYLPQRLKVTNFPDKWQKLIKALDQQNPMDLYRMTICLWGEDGLRELMNGKLIETEYERAFRDKSHWPLIKQLMYVDQKTYLPDAMLTKVDRASMAVGLEVRVPLLDHRIVEFSTHLPGHLNYRDGSGKYLLSKLLARYMPTHFFKRPKMGFGVPLNHWFRHDLKALLQDYLSENRLTQEGIFNSSLVQKTIKEHMAGIGNHQYRLWPILMWQMWREKWLS